VKEALRPFDLRSFEDEARALLEEARARSKEILRGADAEAQGIREEARRAGREQGRAEGREAAAAAERERIGRETSGLADLLRAAARQVEARRSALAAEAERDLVRLAVAVAEKIVRAEIRSGRPVAAANLRRAVELVTHRRRLKALLHPEDLAAVEACLPALRADLANLGTLDLEESGTVSRGGCVLVTEEGSVDADVRTQLEEIERGLTG
jgi:flagellar assembly protein FliH